MDFLKGKKEKPPVRTVVDTPKKQQPDKNMPDPKDLQTKRKAREVFAYATDNQGQNRGRTGDALSGTRGGGPGKFG